MNNTVLGLFVFDMENYTKKQATTPNTEEKKIVPVVQGKVKKKNPFEKAVDAFVMEDMKTIKEHLVSDYVIPGVKRVLADTLTNAINMVLFGSSAAPKSTGWFGSGSSVFRYGTNLNYTPYNAASSSNSVTSWKRNDIPTYDEIVVPTKAAAEQILDDLEAIIGRFGHATINDLYEMVSIAGEPTYNNYGWTSLKGADIGIVRDGYLIKMPRAVLIK